MSAIEMSCLVCGDDGAANHYGSVCCSGCKHFFRRTVLENKEHSCPYSNCCTINKETRNFCRGCRYRKCLAVGMNPKTIREKHGNKAYKPDVKKVENQKIERENEVKVRKLIKIPSKLEEKVIEKKSKNTIHEYEVEQIVIACKYFARDKNLPLGTLDIIPAYYSEDVASIAKYYILVDKLCDLYSDSKLDHLCKEFDGKCSVNVPLDKAIREPRVICYRTPINWDPKVVLKTELNLRTYCRVITLFFDWASHIKELSELEESDKTLQLGCRTISACTLICGHKSAIREVDGILHSGGTYFPANRPESLDRNMRLLNTFMQHSIKEIIEPMRKLKITEGEIALLRVISALTPVPGLSKTAFDTLHTARNRYIEVLSEMVRKTSGSSILASLNRISQLMSLVVEADKVAELADRMMGYMSAFSLGEIRGTLPYEIHISRHNSCFRKELTKA